jgi:hypothetical protein
VLHCWWWFAARCYAALFVFEWSQWGCDGANTRGHTAIVQGSGVCVLGGAECMREGACLMLTVGQSGGGSDVSKAQRRRGCIGQRTSLVPTVRRVCFGGGCMLCFVCFLVGQRGLGGQGVTVPTGRLCCHV